MTDEYDYVDGDLRAPSLAEMLSDAFCAIDYDDLSSKPFPSEHAARLKSPNIYKRFRRENNKFGTGIDAVWGVRKDNNVVELQAIRFDRTRFTPAQARKWLRDHDYAPILFEEATGKNKTVYAGDDGAEKEGKGRSTDMTEAAAGIEKTADAVVGERALNKGATYHRPLGLNFIQMKATALSGKNGSVEGYLSAFNVIDHQGDVVRPGAFTKSIAERGQAGKIPLMVRHFAAGGDILDCVGTIMELKEDEYGLWFRGNFHSDQRAQDVRKKTTTLLADGISLGSSIGYRPVKWGFMTDPATQKRITELQELALVEGTLTLKPANEGAVITGAKDFVKNSTALAAVTNADPSSMSPEERGRVIDAAFGDREKAEAARKDLEGLLAKIGGLLSSEPQGTSAGAGGPKKGSSTKAVVDLHSVSASIAKMKAAAMRAKAATHRG